METPSSPDLGQAKIENARQAVEQAIQELNKAQTDEEIDLWANRLKQRKADLRRIEENLQEEQVAA